MDRKRPAIILEDCDDGARNSRSLPFLPLRVRDPRLADCGYGNRSSVMAVIGMEIVLHSSDNKRRQA